MGSASPRLERGEIGSDDAESSLARTFHCLIVDTTEIC